MHHKAEKHPFVCLFWSPAPLRCPWWMVLRARRMGCSQQKLRGCGAASHRCQPRFPSPPPRVSEACVSEEGIHVHMEMPGLPPPHGCSHHRDRRQETRTPMPALSWHKERLFSQHPEASHDSVARLRHCFTHPGPGRAGKRGDRLPVQSHYPNRPTESCPSGLVLKSTQTSPRPQYPAP